LTLATLQKNAILNGLEPSEAEDILRRGKLVDLKTRAVIYQADELMREAFFPIDAVLSVVTQMKNGSSIEVGTIGREGVSAIPLLLGATTSANESYCQVPGRAVVISADHFRALSHNYRFRRLLDRFLQAYVNMLGQLAACNGMHSIYERTARWLLMTRDRANSDDFYLTHKVASYMLGVRREGVTEAALGFQKRKWIRYRRGHVTILDPAALEAATCDCYAAMARVYAQIMS